MISASNPTTPSPGRKPPHCRKCGRPMKGHPKLLSCTTSQDSEKDTPLSVKSKQSVLIREFDNLQLSSEDANDVLNTIDNFNRRVTFKGETVEKADTLLSLSSTENSTLDCLKMPGMFMTSLVDDTEAAGSGTRQCVESVLLGKNPTEIFVNDDVASVASSTKSFGRTNSIEDRAKFIATLEDKSKKPVARVFTVNVSEIEGIQEEAKRLRLHARIIAPKYVNGLKGDGWLVIGQDKSHVEDLYKKICEDVKSSKTLSTAIKGGAVGAVTTWLCLAYS